MGQLVMSFRGLWIHVNPSSQGYNVSAVNASASNGTPYTPQGFSPVVLPRHFFSIQAIQEVKDLLIGAGLNIENMGSGWTLSVANTINDAPVSVDLTTNSDPPQETPHLTTFDPTMSLVDPVTAWAAAIVEISRGSVQATLFEPSTRNAGLPGIYTTWTVQTDGNPTLVFTPPPGTSAEPVSVPIPSTPTDPPLLDGVPGSLVLHNSTESSAPDSPWDFALYYLAANGGIPATFATPLPGSPSADSIPRLTGTKSFQIRLWLAQMEVWLIEHLTIVAMDTGTSCSNSQYP